MHTHRPLPSHRSQSGQLTTTAFFATGCCCCCSATTTTSDDTTSSGVARSGKIGGAVVVVVVVVVFAAARAAAADAPPAGPRRTVEKAVMEGERTSRTSRRGRRGGAIDEWCVRRFMLAFIWGVLLGRRAQGGSTIDNYYVHRPCHACRPSRMHNVFQV